MYLAGQVAEDRNADITGQTQSVLAQIDKLLAEAATDKRRILSATIYLADMADYAAMNAVWDAWVPQGDPPARATVEARLAHPLERVRRRPGLVGAAAEELRSRLSHALGCRKRLLSGLNTAGSCDDR